jgi:hypothetical protein
MRWTRHVAGMRKMSFLFKIIVGITEGGDKLLVSVIGGKIEMKL